VDAVAEGSSVAFAHFRVAAQNVVLLGILGGGICTCIGPAGPACIELAGSWFVLICEEGLVPPINTDSSGKCLRQIEATKEKNRGGKEKFVAYLAIA